MGRGQATVEDRFSTVFGERRGSQAAQEERDREETEELIRRTFEGSRPITPRNLTPLIDLFDSDDPEIQAVLADSIVANYRRNSMEALASTLGSEGIVPEVRVFLRALAVDYFEHDRSAFGEPQRKQDQALYFLQQYFNSAPVRSPEEMKKDLPLIRALARTYRSKEARLSCMPLLKYLLLLQDNDILPIFSPWVKAVCQEVKAKRCDNRLDDPLFTKLLHADENEESPLRKKILAPLREAVSEAQSRILEMNMRTLLKNGD